VGVIISSACVKWFGWTIADPICSFCIAITILLGVIPLLKQSATTLALRIPYHLQDDFTARTHKLHKLEGVEQVVAAHIWKQSSTAMAACIRLQVGPYTDQPKVRRQVAALFAGQVEHLCIQIDKEKLGAEGVDLLASQQMEAIPMEAVGPGSVPMIAVPLPTSGDGPLAGLSGPAGTSAGVATSPHTISISLDLPSST